MFGLNSNLGESISKLLSAILLKEMPTISDSNKFVIVVVPKKLSTLKYQKRNILQNKKRTHTRTTST